MKKQTKKNLMIGGIILSVIILLGMGLSYRGVINLPFFSVAGSTASNCGSFSTFSISNVEIQETGNRILIYGSSRGADCLQTIFTASQLDQLLNPKGYDATQSVEFKIEPIKEAKVFPIDKGDYFKIYQIGPKKSGILCSVDNCYNDYPSDSQKSDYRPISSWSYNPIIGLIRTCVCVFPTKSGIRGSFASARSYKDFSIRFTVNGQSVDLTPQSQSISIAGGKALIQYQGSLSNIAEISSPQYKARFTGSEWTLVSDNIDSQLSNAYSRLISCLDYQKYDSCKSDYDISVSNAFANKNSEYLASNSNILSGINLGVDSSLNGNLVDYFKAGAGDITTFTLTLDATWAGIRKMSGMPDITSCAPSQSINSGDKVYPSFTVKNVGNGAGKFLASLTCGNNVYAVSSEQPTLLLGESRTLTLEFTGSNTQQSNLVGSCNLKVYDFNNPSNYDTCSFGYTVKYQSGQICQAGTRTCKGDLSAVQVCNNDGKSWSETKCDYVCTYVGGNAQCSQQSCVKEGESATLSSECCSGLVARNGKCEKESGTSCHSCDEYAISRLIGSFWKSKSCTGGLLYNIGFCGLAIIKFLLTPLIFLFSILFGIRFFRAFDVLESNKWALWVVTVLVAGLITWAYFTMFIVGVWIFAIYIVISSILNFIGIKKLRKMILR